MALCARTTTLDVETEAETDECMHTGSNFSYLVARVRCGNFEASSTRELKHYILVEHAHFANAMLLAAIAVTARLAVARLVSRILLVLLLALLFRLPIGIRW